MLISSFFISTPLFSAYYWSSPRYISRNTDKLNKSDVKSVDVDGRVLVFFIEEGKKSANLRIPSNDPETPILNIPLSGTGTREEAPQPDIKANGFDGPLTIPYGTNLTVTIALDPAGYDGEECDWWVVGGTSFGLFWYTLDRGWVRSDVPIRVYGGPLFDLSPFEVLNISGLPVGAYTFYFGVDMLMNGSLDLPELYYDSVGVTIE